LSITTLKNEEKKELFKKGSEKIYNNFNKSPNPRRKGKGFFIFYAKKDGNWPKQREKGKGKGSKRGSTKWHSIPSTIMGVWQLPAGSAVWG
jgi:hypothetical protein